MTKNETTLKRSLSLPLITFYGLGNILGAGIYVLIGKVAGEAGYFAPLAFFIASIIAAITAFTYAELSARYPVSAGEAVYLYEGFRNSNLSKFVGILIALAGIVSAAAIAHGFAGYLQVFVDIPAPLIISSILILLGVLTAWGISQSVAIAAAFTVIEILGLLLIIGIGADHLPEFTEVVATTHTRFSAIPWLGVMSGAFLAFYAYIGFEDMVNVAEEVKNPQRNMPMAILIAVIISTLLYGAVSIISVSVLSPEQLSASDAPLAAVYSEVTGEAPVLITVIGLFAVINGALIQIIMASRLLYGMAIRHWLPQPLAKISPRTRTPINSTIVVVVSMLFFALILPLVTLAELTSYIVLTVFALVNLALIKIKKQSPQPTGVSVFSIWIPRLGFVTTLLFLLNQLISNF
ncbi:MAG: amino acid permease [Gammaproteobacteria bacterium]|nr:MAG: amino acid permease [Gammaproteobacteria bacterium]RLA61092.1 MAG: amino acid permease [Gammaproteobacteria bacterium]